MMSRSATDDILMLEKGRQNKKNERKDEVVLSQVERINDAISRVETKLTDSESDFTKSCAYYEREMKYAEETCEREIQKLRDALESKIQTLEAKRDSKVNYYLSQLNMIKSKHDSRKDILESIIERKEKRLERVARKITTTKGKQELQNEVILPDMQPEVKQPTGPTNQELAVERRLAQNFLQNGGSVHDLNRMFPNFYKELKREEEEAEEARRNSPEARQAKAEEENIRLAQEAEEERKKQIIVQCNEKVKKAEREFKDAKAQGKSKKEIDELRMAYDNAMTDYTLQKELLRGY